MPLRLTARLLLTVLAPTVLPLLAVAPTYAASRPVATVIADCVDHSVRPHRIVIACGDGALFVVVRRYRTWGQDRARGRGAIWANDCEPTCADGTFHRTRARIHLYRPVSTSGTPVFTRMAVRWHAGDRHGRDVYWLPETGI